MHGILTTKQLIIVYLFSYWKWFNAVKVKFPMLPKEYFYGCFERSTCMSLMLTNKWRIIYFFLSIVLIEISHWIHEKHSNNEHSALRIRLEILLRYGEFSIVVARFGAFHYVSWAEFVVSVFNITLSNCRHNLTNITGFIVICNRYWSRIYCSHFEMIEPDSLSQKFGKL